MRDRVTSVRVPLFVDRMIITIVIVVVIEMPEENS